MMRASTLHPVQYPNGRIAASILIYCTHLSFLYDTFKSRIFKLGLVCNRHFCNNARVSLLCAPSFLSVLLLLPQYVIVSTRSNYYCPHCSCELRTLKSRLPRMESFPLVIRRLCLNFKRMQSQQHSQASMTSQF